MVDGFPVPEDNTGYHGMVSDTRHGGVIGPFMLNIMSKHQLGRACSFSYKSMIYQRSLEDIK